MEAAVAPVSLKGTREPLLLIATGLFLCSFWLPITGVLGFAGIALGMHDLRRSNAASTLGRLRIVVAVASWCSCGYWLTYYFLMALPDWPFVLQTLTLCGTGVALGKLARVDGASGLARAFLVLAWAPLAFVPLVEAGVLAIAMMVYTTTMLALALLGLRLHARAVPYGKRRARRVA